MTKQENDTGVLTKLAGRGEEAVNRLMEELGRNERVTDALARAMEAKGKVDERTRRTLGTVGLAAADQLEGLRKQIEVLEKRLAALEKSESARATPAGGSSAATDPTAAKTGTQKRSAAAKPKSTGATTARKRSSSTGAKKPSGSEPESGAGSGTA